MKKAVLTKVSGRSDSAAFAVVARESIGRVVAYYGSEAPGMMSRAIDAVRRLLDPGYTIGDAQVDQQMVANDASNERLLDAVARVDEVDRASVLSSAARLVVAQDEITEESAALLERLGQLLELAPDQVEYLVVGALDETAS